MPWVHKAEGDHHELQTCLRTDRHERAVKLVGFVSLHFLLSEKLMRSMMMNATVTLMRRTSFCAATSGLKARISFTLWKL